jgi:hypothetical protein
VPGRAGAVAVYQPFTLALDTFARAKRDSVYPPIAMSCGRTIMSSHMHAALASEMAETAGKASSAKRDWIVNALTIVFMATAIVLVSFVAVVVAVV